MNHRLTRIVTTVGIVGMLVLLALMPVIHHALDGYQHADDLYGTSRMTPACADVDVLPDGTYAEFCRN